ncbi:MAG: hypothetical protein AAFR35_02480 [Pseudomonadota bacterium]
MICPMVEQAHFGTTRYTTLVDSVIHVPGKPIVLPLPHLRALLRFLDGPSEN